MTPVTFRANVAAVVLAGGFGTRIRNLINDIPKPMARVLGRPFLEWIVIWLHGSGIGQIAISTGYRGECISRHFDGQDSRLGNVVCVPESSPLGTAGGFLNASAGSGFSPDLWVVVNGDSMALGSVSAVCQPVLDGAFDVAMLGVSVEDAGRYGALRVSAAGELLGFDEKQGNSGLINGGIYAFAADTVKSFSDKRPLSFEFDVFPALLTSKVRIRVIAVAVPFLDIGTPESFHQTEAFVSSHIQEIDPESIRSGSGKA